MLNSKLIQIFNLIARKALVSIRIFAFFVATFASQNIIAKKETAQSIEELKIQLENVLKDMLVPGMSIAIAHRDGLTWTAGLGKADIASNRPATASTLFRIGSISKGFISLAILKLTHEGKLSLNDTVQKLTPEIWFQNKWEATDPIRVIHLLENTTGWDDMHLRELAKNPSEMTSLDAFNYGHSSRVSRWRPATRMAYSNSGPAVAAYIVEKVVGKDYEKYVEQELFKPIGMQTASYFQPSSQLATTLYQSDGKTPYSYWNLLYRSIGSINASANDMANYLLFYLNHGKVLNTQVIPATLLDRMKVPSSTWAAREGSQVGYGLGNYCTIYDGFVYHGHDGNLPGALSAVQYLPNEGIGYFYSINTDNRKGFEKIGAIIRAYITRQLQKPSIAPEVSLSEKTIDAYTGWYEPNSPRLSLFYFLERLFGLSYVHFKDNKLFVSSLNEVNATFLPVSNTQFRYVPLNAHPDPIPTLTLLTPNDQEQFMQLSLGLKSPTLLHLTLQRIPTWLAIIEIITVLFVLACILSLFAYSPFLIGQILSKKKYSAGSAFYLCPLIALT